MSDEPKESRERLRVLITDPVVRRWMIRWAIAGFIVSMACMIPVITDGQPHAAREWAWLLVLIAGSTLQFAGYGFCFGYLAIRLKQRNAAP
jgi:hypothetical protein